MKNLKVIFANGQNTNYTKNNQCGLLQLSVLKQEKKN